MKTEKADWDGFQVKPPPLRQKSGITTEKRLAEPAKPAVGPGPSAEQLAKCISRRSHSVAKKAGKSVPQRQAGESVPQRQAGEFVQARRSCPVLVCGNEKTYFRSNMQAIEKASAVVVPSAHNLAKPCSSETWLGVIAHGKTVHARKEKMITRFDVASLFRMISAQSIHAS